MEKSEKPLLPRTDGDGMENSAISFDIAKKRPRKISLSNKVIYRPAEHCRSQLHPVHPKTTPKYVKPKLMPKEPKKVTSLSYNKEPKFVPREPFKGAVTPIIVQHKKIKKPKIKNNNVDIQVLVSQMTNLATLEMRKISCQMPAENIKDPSALLAENEQLEKELTKLKDTNEQLEKQLKFQTQVNTELKTLLVAAVGEDLEARVQLLTEDKLQLDRALLSSAEHLSTHREQVEWLAGHCEVWRSKFLASSLMVDELARWKTVLTTHLNELQDALKCLLEEQNGMNVDITNTWQTLQEIANRCNVGFEGNTKDIINVTRACHDLTVQVAGYLLGPNFVGPVSGQRSDHSSGELLAQKALLRTNSLEQQKFGTAYSSGHKSSKQCPHCQNHYQNIE